TSGSSQRPPASRRAAPVPAPLPRRNLPALPPRLGQADRDRLPPALHLLPGTPALERSALRLVQGLSHVLLGTLPVTRHGFSVREASRSIDRPGCCSRGRSPGRSLRAPRATSRCWPTCPRPR